MRAHAALEGPVVQRDLISQCSILETETLYQDVSTILLMDRHGHVVLQMQVCGRESLGPNTQRVGSQVLA
jgi:hypothetical protein